LAFWDFLRKAEPGEVAVAVPLNYDVGQATYPDASFESFATEGYAKSEIVHACIRELAVSAASPRYYVQAPATDGGAVEITSGLLYNLTITSAAGKKTNLVVAHKQTIVTPYCETDPVENIV